MTKHQKQASSWTSAYGGRNDLVGQIYFPFDSSSLDENDKLSLNFMTEQMSSMALSQMVKLKFFGHCDSRGSDEYNRKLALRRASAVQEYVRGRVLVDRRTRFFTSTAISRGEQFAGADMDADRRVDIISSDVPKPPPGVKPPVSIEGKPSVKLVRRPVQILQMDLVPVQGRTSTSVIVEKYGMVPIDHTFPCDMKVIKSWMHMGAPRSFSIPAVHVYRNEIKWRKEKGSDTTKKVVAAILNYLGALTNKPGPDFDFGERVPGLTRAYKSWDDYKKRGSGHWLKYQSM